MKSHFVVAVLLLSSISEARLRTEKSIVDCTVSKVEDVLAAQEIVTASSSVSIRMVYEGTEFSGYAATIGNVELPFMTASSVNSLVRENIGYGEAFKIVETEANRRFVVVIPTSSNQPAELFIGAADASQINLTAQLHCE